MSNSTVFVPNGDSRRETAILLVGTAEEHGIGQRSIRTSPSGFFITEELAELVGSEVVENGAEADDDEATDVFTPADYSVEQVKAFVEDHPDLADDVLLSEQAGKNRSTLVDWLTAYIETSGDRAEKN